MYLDKLHVGIVLFVFTGLVGKKTGEKVVSKAEASSVNLLYPSSPLQSCNQNFCLQIHLQKRTKSWIFFHTKNILCFSSQIMLVFDKTELVR